MRLSVYNEPIGYQAKAYGVTYDEQAGTFVRR